MKKTFEELGFKVGQKIKCVKSSFYKYEEGKIYTITDHKGSPVISKTLNGFGGDWEIVEGNLQDLNLSAGDVVECVEDAGFNNYTVGRHYTINKSGKTIQDSGMPVNGWESKFKIISRADDTPKKWGDMTPEEKGALLLAHHEGKVIEYWSMSRGCWVCFGGPSWSNDLTLRVRPEPVREKCNLYIHSGDGPELTAIGTIEVVDGNPDCDTIKMVYLYNYLPDGEWLDFEAWEEDNWENLCGVGFYDRIDLYEEYVKDKTDA